jgi:hypothetical protein
MRKEWDWGSCQRGIGQGRKATINQSIVLPTNHLQNPQRFHLIRLGVQCVFYGGMPRHLLSRPTSSSSPLATPLPTRRHWQRLHLPSFEHSFNLLEWFHVTDSSLVIDDDVGGIEVVVLDFSPHLAASVTNPPHRGGLWPCCGWTTIASLVLSGSHGCVNNSTQYKNFPPDYSTDSGEYGMVLPYHFLFQSASSGPVWTVGTRSSYDPTVLRSGPSRP